jgi:hypothetical protein
VDSPAKTIQVYRISGYVIGPCEKYGMGYECLSCGHSERVDRVEWIEGDKLPPDWGLA